MTVAKPLANGLPIGAVLMKQKVADVMAPGDHGSTFAGGRSYARRRTVFDRITAPGFLANVTARGEELNLRSPPLLADHPRLREVRGAGLLVGAQRTSPSAPSSRRVARTACSSSPPARATSYVSSLRSS